VVVRFRIANGFNSLKPRAFTGPRQQFRWLVLSICSEKSIELISPHGRQPLDGTDLQLRADRLCSSRSLAAEDNLAPLRGHIIPVWQVRTRSIACGTRRTLRRNSEPCRARPATARRTSIEQISRESLTAVDRWMAIVEQRRSARVNAGMKAADRRGVHCGRRKTEFDEALAIQLHLQGKSIRQIAATLDVDWDRRASRSAAPNVA
jgi:hypothetical protein